MKFYQLFPKKLLLFITLLLSDIIWNITDPFPQKN